jgi:predicted patatin/cPLA2 family phospholipase
MKTKRALVISGGGALGAYAGGIAQNLYVNHGREYDLVVGTSTGALLSPLISVNNYNKLRKAYTSIEQKDIFTFNPFTKKGGINIFKVLWRIIANEKTLGNSDILLETIKKYFDETDYHLIQSLEKEIVATVYNLTTKEVEYKSSKNLSYDEICKWIWVSANSPILMSLYNENGCDYTDGGVAEHVPIRYAIDKGIKEIDVIILKSTEKKRANVKGVLSNLSITLEGMKDEVSSSDVIKAMLLAELEGVKLNLFYMRKGMTENTLQFDKVIMNSWWEEGFNRKLYL